MDHLKSNKTASLLGLLDLPIRYFKNDIETHNSRNMSINKKLVSQFLARLDPLM